MNTGPSCTSSGYKCPHGYLEKKQLILPIIPGQKKERIKPHSSQLSKQYSDRYTEQVYVVSAISDLKQQIHENVGSFMDSVKVAVSMLNYNLAEADRKAASREGYTRMVVAQFSSGISEELRGKVFGVPNPPVTIEAALVAAAAAEVEKSSSKFIIGLVNDKNQMR